MSPGFWIRSLVLVAALVLLGPVHGQEEMPPASGPAEAPAEAPEVPPPPEVLPEEATAPEESEPSAEEATAVLELPPAPEPAAPRRIIVLPVEFVVYEKSVAGVEAVPGWSEVAQISLAEASVRMLQLEDRFAAAPMPSLDEPAQGVLREHIELFKIIANTVTGVVYHGGKAWAEKKTSFDYTLGEGLAFVAEAAGVDYAFILTGVQVKQTGGSVLFQLLAAAGGVGLPGGGMYAVGGIVELRSGRVVWINSVQGGEIFGMTSNDVRKPESADAVLRSMFAGYPASRLVTLRMF